ncbi:phosphoglycolate phosphatase [Pararhodobacter marinus]|uniref:Phosphoglycolate phosphatase n=1 Tax=Pararhodobacter marinus TaxID=2184063 RepID=A0A2U2CIW6_9RHOB|nr:phosphoglycolate phosphatase [Pararhodobacter marinus]PWE31830.1 phosphoglycolate phosphatase [Pararhodobacter marinus]
MRIVFDLDGTLIDSAPDIAHAANAVLQSEGLPPVTLAQTRSFVGNGARVFVERLERASAGGNAPDRTARMRARFITEYERAHGHTAIYPGVEAAIATLRAQGWRIGLCTNKPMVPTRAVLAHFGWSDLFETVLGGDSLPQMKPDPAPLHAVLQTLGDGPALYVGDSEVDALTAQAADVPFALFTEGYRKTGLDAIPHTEAFADWSALPAIAARLIA